MDKLTVHTDYPIWEVIQRGNGPEAIKSRFGGNDESKKMQKYILKQQFEGFSVSNSEGLHKGYDRFQSLLSQLEIHGAGVSTEDANQKFLRSLPSAWSQVSLIMRTKPGVDSLSFDDLYNNLRVFESDVKGSTTSSSSTQNVAFVSENTSSTNDVSTAYGVSNSSGHNSQYEHTSSYSLLANQSSCPQLDHEDLEQLDSLNLEEIDLKWQVAMISIRMKKFYKKTGRKLQFDAKEPVGFDKTKVECYSCHKTGHFARECRSKGNQDGRRRDAWNTGNKEKDNRRRSGKQEDSKLWLKTQEVTSCSKECKESYAKLKKLYDEQREQLGDASIEIQAYTQALKKVEAQLVAHQQDSEDEHCVSTTKEKEKYQFADTEHVKLPSKRVIEQNTCSQSPKPDKKNCSGLMSKKLGLGYGFTTKACFVCGSLSHLIRDCDFHEKRMAKQFVPTALLTRTGRIPVNIARHNFNSQAVSTSAARKVNVVRPIVNDVRPKTVFHKTHTHIKSPFNRTTTPRTKFSNQKVNTVGDKAVSAVGGIRETAVKPSADCNWRSKRHYWNKFSKYNGGLNSRKCVNFKDPLGRPKPKMAWVPKRKHMTGNKAYLAEYQDYNGGLVSFGGSKCYITGKGKIKIGKLDFEDVCFVKELQHFNLFSVSQMCDKKNKVLFIDTECLVLSSDFKLPDENQVLLRIPKQNNMYSFNIENIVPSGGLACLITKATFDESNKWHRRLGHVNFKNLNKLVKGNLVRGLPSKIFQNDLLVRKESNTRPPNIDIIEFCGSKGIKREYSNARTPQQNGVAERKNRNLIEASRTMLVDSFLPNTFWAEVISIACYVLNRVLVIKPQNKTPYELITGKIPIISYIRPFGCHVTILNTIDHLGKFEGKSDEGFLVGYSLNSKAFRPVRSENQANKTAEAPGRSLPKKQRICSFKRLAAKASSTEQSLNTASTPVSTASPYGGLSFTDLTNTDQDDSEITFTDKFMTSY
ncbi:ribonuclease H-like domain-containing protein [Tanacetum coccineum]